MDGSVDLADVDVIRENFGVLFPVSESLPKGDGTRDGFVDLRDFLDVRKIINPPTPLPEGDGNAVPEPSGSFLAILGLIVSLAITRPRRAIRSR